MLISHQQPKRVVIFGTEVHKTFLIYKMSDRETEVSKEKMRSPDGQNNDGQDGKRSFLKGFRIPKRKRERNYDYEDESDDDLTDPYEESSDDYESDPDWESDHKRHHMADVAHDDSDTERFDPLNDESTFVLNGSMERYVHKYFNTHVTDDCLQAKVFDVTPIPENDVFSPPQADDFIDDLVGNYRPMRFLKIKDNSLKNIQKKLVHTIALSKIWTDIDGVR